MSGEARCLDAAGVDLHLNEIQTASHTPQLSLSSYLGAVN